MRHTLELLGGHLFVGTKSAHITLTELVNKYGITDIYAKEQYASYEMNLVGKVMEILPGICFHFFWGKTLYHKDDIPFEINKIPLTSKAYRIPAAKKAEPRDSFEIPKRISSVKNIENTNFPSYLDYGFDIEEYNSAMPFVEGGESAALERTGILYVQIRTFNRLQMEQE